MRAKTKEPIETKGDAIVLALRARGVDSTDLRYCVHEASHALDAKLREPWSNKAVDRAMKRIGPVRAARSEILARAVEQLVCKRLGVETRSLETWVGMSVMEAIKFRDPFLSYEDALVAAKRTMGTAEAEDRATEIVALVMKADGVKRVPVKSKRTQSTVKT